MNIDEFKSLSLGQRKDILDAWINAKAHEVMDVRTFADLSNDDIRTIREILNKSLRTEMWKCASKEDLDRFMRKTYGRNGHITMRDMFFT